MLFYSFRVVFSGEVFNFYDDMPGTINDKNEFTNCKYKIANSSDFVNTNFRIQPFVYTRTNVNEWQIDTTGYNSLVTWDVNPH